MELWIRNQNKNLLTKTDYVEYSLWNEQHRIYCNGEVVAIYDSKERALEVLDEIQNILKPIIINKQIKSDGMLADGLSDGVLHTYDVSEIQELSTYIYEMPKK